MQKRISIIAAIIFFSCTMLVSQAFSEIVPVKSFNKMYSILPGAGKVDNSSEIKMAMRYVEQLQLKRNRLVLKYKGPKEILRISPKYIAISLNASVKKQGNARFKEVPSIFMFLFEVSSLNEMKFYNNLYNSWVGSKELDEYSKTSPDRFCEKFRNEGAEYVYMAEQKEKSIPDNIKNLNGSVITSGVISEQFIDSALTRDTELRKALMPYALKESVNKVQSSASSGDTAQLQARVAQLEKKLRKYEQLFKYIKISGQDIVFSGVNIRVENGTGSTARTNGTGNIIVGYGSAGSGSHNIAVGSRNKFTSYGCFVSGEGNTVANKYSAVVGGNDNKATGQFSTILGGEKNKARGKYSSINGQSGRIKGGKNPHLKK